MYICNTTHTWIHLNLSMYGMCGCGWHNHPGTKCVKLCTGIEERICIYSFHLDAHSIRTKICMVYCQHAVGGTNHRALSSFYPHSSCMVGGLDGFCALLVIYPRHCGWLLAGYIPIVFPLYISPIQHITMIIAMISALKRTLVVYPTNIQWISLWKPDSWWVDWHTYYYHWDI
jgi:hypothetical protein